MPGPSERPLYPVAIHDDTIVLNDVDDSSYTWSPRTGDRPQLADPSWQPFLTDITDRYAFVTNFRTGRLVALDTGETLAEVGPGVAGTFDPTGRYVVTHGTEAPDTAEVFDTRREESMHLTFDSGTQWMRWDQSGSLIVQTGVPADGIANPDRPVKYVVCSPPAFECQPLVGGPETFDGAEGIEPSAVGQLLAVIGSS